MQDHTNTIERVDEDETKLCEVSKHPAGIIPLYILAVVGLIIAAGLGFFLLPAVMEDVDAALFVGAVFTGISVLLTALVIAIATHIFRQNRLIVTNRNITQTLQNGLFDRKVSQLNMYNVEDVTVSQEGFLATIMNFGTLKIETAGEQENFNYTFCPQAGYYAKIILDNREKMLGQIDTAEADAKRPAPGPRQKQKATTANRKNQAAKNLGITTLKRTTTNAPREVK